MKQFICTPTEPIVQTREGRVRGFRYGDMYHFYGIKYADAARFQMPKRCQPWEGVKDALKYGDACVLMDPDGIMDDITIPHRCWPKSEDCQYINVWTSSLDSKAKKPVLVWIHGGGYTAGSAIELIAYDGENLAEWGDIVVVSLNHRLNIVGYLDLSGYGDRYWNTANLGQADLVTALEWVQDNIAAFGGDPDNVTIYGQSGGGGKVHSLLQTPAADKLFHRAIIQSGMWHEFGYSHGTKEDHKMLCDAMIEYLGGDGPEILEAVPYDELVKAYKAVSPALMASGVSTGTAPLPNDWYLGNALDNDFTEAALSKPVLVGTAFAEFANFSSRVMDKYKMNEDEKLAMIRDKFGDNADTLLAEFKRVYPEKDITDCMVVDAFFRGPTLEFLRKRAALGSTNTFAYIHAPDYPYNGGTAAWHSSDIVFAFHNVEKVPIAHIPCAEKLEEQTAGAWVNFVRCGDPSNDALPEWRPYTTGDEATMVFSENSALRVDHDRDLIDMVQKFSPARRPGPPPAKK